MKTLLKKRSFQFPVGLLLIGIPFVLLHYSPLKSLHGSSEIALIVVIFAYVSLHLSLFLRFSTLFLASTFGYSLCFLLGYFFQTNSPPTESMSTNNLWKIWLISYWVLLGAALVVDIAKLIFKKKRT